MAESVKPVLVRERRPVLQAIRLSVENIDDVSRTYRWAVDYGSVVVERRRAAERNATLARIGDWIVWNQGDAFVFTAAEFERLYEQVNE